MDLQKIFTQVLVLFFTMIVGFFARKKNIIDRAMNKGLTELILNVTLPFMIISSFNHNFSGDVLISGFKLFLISFVMHLFLLLISKFIFYKYPNNLKSVMRFAIIFSNCGFMGYPVVESVYGKIGVLYTAIFNIPFNILIWTAGVMLFNSKSDKNIKKALLNPGIVSVFIGLIIFIFSIKLPVSIIKTLDIVGSITTPLSMIIIGSMIADVNLKEIFDDKKIYYITLLRLIVVPIVTLYILKTFNFKEIFVGIPVLIMAMPVAANTALFAEKFGADINLASRCVFVTTMISTITIPIIIMLL